MRVNGAQVAEVAVEQARVAAFVVELLTAFAGLALFAHDDLRTLGAHGARG